ncbi:MAG: AraC family transcriptional regulator [Phenylobacterium sp.]
MAETIRAAVLTGYADLARAVGLDPLRMLDDAGIPRAALSDPDLRIPTTVVRDLIEASARGAEDFGLRMSDQRTPSIMGPVALIAREQPTVRKVMEAVAEHMSLHSQATTLRLEDAGDLVIIHVRTRFQTPGPTRQAVELGMAQMLRVLRMYLGAQWRPVSVSLVHGPPRSLATHQRIFGPSIDFNQDFDGFVCARQDLERENPAADPEMARQIERYISGLATASEAPLPDRVREVVRGLLSTGRGAIEVVATQMAVDPRTLQRQLAAHGTSFIDILQAVRMELAAPYLEESERPLAEVSELLGFSALSAFSRWHRTHFGHSASDRRRAARARKTASA